MALLEVNNLAVQFQTRDGVVDAVSGLSFHVDEGETLAIVGESGSGKSCTVLSVMRLLPEPYGRIVDGEIIFGGRDLMKLDEAGMRSVRGHRIGMVFQDPMTSLNPLLTVETQIGELLQLHLGMNRVQAREKCIELLNLVGIPEPELHLSSYPHQLSGGMRQRVMIAMGLSCEPKLLIADEPTTALDVTIQAQIVDLIKRLRDRISMSIIWITHDLGVVAGLADRVIVMYAGHVVEEAGVNELFASPQHPYTVGLLESLPRLEGERMEKLTAIEGASPDMSNLPPGCPFEPRCPRAVNKCRNERPVLESCGERHRVACWEAPVDSRATG